MSIAVPESSSGNAETWEKAADPEHPCTFTQKIRHRKLHDRDARLPLLSDKLLVKQHIERALGPEWVIPTLWSGKTLLPRDERNWPIPYVVKANHGWNFNYFARTKEDEDWDFIESRVADWMGTNFGEFEQVWAYSEIEPSLLVEPFIGESIDRLPTDYKFFVFRGHCPFVEVINSVGPTFEESVFQSTFYDRTWERQQVGWRRTPSATELIPRPASYEKMLAAAEYLGSSFSFVRVDFYERQGQPLFGEMTFYPGAGLKVMEPESFDALLGSFWI